GHSLGGNDHRNRAVRDRLLETGQIVNHGRIEKGAPLRLLDHVVERFPSRLYTPTNPTIAHLRPALAPDAAADADAIGDDSQSHLRPAAPRKGTAGTAADADAATPTQEHTADRHLDHEAERLLAKHADVLDGTTMGTREGHRPVQTHPYDGGPV